MRAELDDWLFAECSDAQHASGTCRMGAARRSALGRRSRLPRDRLYGPAGDRRLGHAEVVRANTHLTTVMIAEKMADKLRR